MQLAKVLGTATASIAHRSFSGQKLLIVQPMDARGQPDGDPQIAVDAGQLGASAGQQVLISSDGKGTVEMVGDANTPIRWCVIGLQDCPTEPPQPPRTGADRA